MHPLLGTWPATQACALTGNQTGDPLVHRLELSPLSHTSQCKTYEIFISGTFHLLFPAHGWPWVTEAPASKTMDKRGTTVVGFQKLHFVLWPGEIRLLTIHELPKNQGVYKMAVGWFTRWGKSPFTFVSIRNSLFLYHYLLIIALFPYEQLQTYFCPILYSGVTGLLMSVTQGTLE